MAIEIEMTADVRNVIKALRSGETSLEELESKLDDASDAGKDAGRTIEASTDDATDSIDKTASASSKLGDVLGDVGGIAKDALEGDLAGAADGALGSIAGLAGAAGGLAGTAVVGITELAKGLIDIVQENAEEAEKRVTDSFSKMVEAGSAAFTEGQILEGVQDILTNAERMQQVAEITAASGASQAEVVRALAGDQELLAANILAVDAAYTDLKEAQDAVYNDGGTVTKVEADRLDALGRARDALRNTANETNDAASSYSTYTQAVALGQQATDELSKSLDLLPIEKSVAVKVDVDASAIDRALQRRTLRIDVEGYTRTGQRVV